MSATAPRRKRKAPYSLSHAQSVTAFKLWLAAAGAEILAPTNPYEIVRFRGDRGVSVIYRNDGSRPHAMTGEATLAWSAFVRGETMRFVEAVRIQGRADPIVRTLIERDGATCFYCDAPFSAEVRPTREHLVSRTHGGPDHIANQFLACAACNGRAGHLSAAEKIRMRDGLRADRRRSAFAITAAIAEVCHV